MTNARYLVSRNKREGWYAGKHRQIDPDKNWWEVKKNAINGLQQDIK